MTIDLDNVKIVDSTKGQNFLYETLQLEDNKTIRTRKPITSKKAKAANDVMPEFCVEDVIKEYVNVKSDAKLMDVFMKNSLALMEMDNIHKDDEDGNYYTSATVLAKMIQRGTSGKVADHSFFDFNVTRPGCITLGGFVHAAGAVLGGFLIDDDKLQSLAEVNGNPTITLNGDNGSGHLAGGNLAWDANGNLILSGYVNALGGTFSGSVEAETFKSKGINSYKIVSYNISELASQIIGRFPYTVFRMTPDSNNQQLLIGRGAAGDEGKIMYVINTHSSYNIDLINGDYLTGILGRITLQPRGTVQLMWSQDSSDWIILSYFQTPTGWRAN